MKANFKGQKRSRSAYTLYT